MYVYVCVNEFVWASDCAGGCVCGCIIACSCDYIYLCVVICFVYLHVRVCVYELACVRGCVCLLDVVACV